MQKKYFVLSGIVLTVLLVIFYPNTLKLYFCDDPDFSCRRAFNLIRIILLIGPALLVSSLVALKVSEAASLGWQKMTLYFIPVYLFIVVLMPWSVGDEIAGFTKGMAGLVLALGYTLFSVVYLLVKNKKTA